MKLLQDKRVLITGGNKGIGLAIATHFAEHGAHLFLVGTDEEAGAKAAHECIQRGGQAEFVRADVSNCEEIHALVAKIGAVDVLVNNAGITRDRLLMSLSEEDWDRVIAVNLKSVYNTCHALVRSFLKAKKGKIINITSVVGLVGNPGQTNYAAAKAGMIGFTKALAKELASRNINVNAIAPGFIQTQMTGALNTEQQEKLLEQIPMHRMGTPMDIAAAALFLASEWSNYITGHVLTVDGGMAM